MGRLLPRTTKSRLHVGAGFALVVALLAAYFTFFAKPASAHHALIQGTTTCSDEQQVVDFSAESWQHYLIWGGGNPHIDVSYRLRVDDDTPSAWTTLPWNPAWHFGTDNDFQFTGSFTLPPQPAGTEVQLEANAGAPWSSGWVGSDPYPSDWIILKKHCGPTTTTTTTTCPTTTTTSSTTTTAPTTSTTTAPTTSTTTSTTTTTAPTTTTSSTTTTAPTTTTSTTAPTTSTTTTTAPTTTTSTTTSTTAPTTSTTTSTTAPTTSTTTSTTTAPTTTTSTTTSTTTTIVVSPTSVVQPTTTISQSASPSAAVLGVSEVQGATLPATGANTTGLVVIGGALLAAGLCLVRAARLPD